VATNVVERAMGLGLNVIRQVAGSEWIERTGLRPSVEKLMHGGAKQVGRGMTVATKAFAGNKRPRDKVERLESEVRLDDFDLSPTEDQTLVLDTAKRFAEDVLRPAAEPADTECDAPRDVLEAAYELGLASLVVPESLGGAATAHASTTVAMVAEALAHGDAALAAAILAPVGVASLLADHGTKEQQAKYLPAFVGEKFVAATIAMHEPGVLADPSKPSTKARKNGSGYVLDGVKTLVPLARIAELFIVSASLPNGGAGLFLLEGGTKGATVEAEPTMGLRGAGLGRLRLDGVSVPTDALIGGASASAVLQSAIDRARIAWCALATGTSQAVLEYTTAYANDRIAFGEPISHKQAVAFMIANIAIETDCMRLLTLRAASRVDGHATFTREAFLARVFAADKAMEIGSNGVQLLGGHGFIRDYPVERWYRQLRGLGIVEGGIAV